MLILSLMKAEALWDVALCWRLNSYIRFGDTCYLLLHGLSVQDGSIRYPRGFRCA